MGRAIILVMDSFGIGATDDADKFGDVGSNTFGSIASFRAGNGDPLKLPNLATTGVDERRKRKCGSLARGLRD